MNPVFKVGKSLDSILEEKNMKIRMRDIGRQCQVQFTDAGRLDGILVDYERDTKRTKVYLFADRSLNTVEPSMVVGLYDRIIPQI